MEEITEAREQEEQLAARDKRVAWARQFTLLSNEFMAVVLNDIPACQHVLRILTGMPDLIVKEVRVQYRISKIASHDAILDVLAQDSEGRLYNIEIQRSDTIDHARRTRFYGATIDSEFLQKGRDYHEMPEVRLIYISETDIWRKGKTAYKVKKVFEGIDEEYEDGIHVTYVNTAVNDGSEIAGLMEYFKTADPEDLSQGDLSQGDLSRRVRFLKCEEGGYREMCEITDEIRREGIEEGIKEGVQQQAQMTVLNLVGMGLSVARIAQAVDVDIEIVKKWIRNP